MHIKKYAYVMILVYTFFIHHTCSYYYNIHTLHDIHTYIQHTYIHMTSWLHILLFILYLLHDIRNFEGVPEGTHTYMYIYV